MQGIRVDVLHAQARRRVPVIQRDPTTRRHEIYEAVLTGGLRDARERWPGLAHIAFGDLFPGLYPRVPRGLVRTIGWSPMFPLFGSAPRSGTRV